MKRKIILFSFISAVFILFFTGCISKTVKTKILEYSNKFYLTSDTTKGGLSLSIQVEMPVKFHNKNVLDTIRKQLISRIFGEEYQSLPLDSVIPAFANSQRDDYLENNLAMLKLLKKDSPYNFNYEHNIEAFALWDDQNIFSYGIKRYVSMGGAHGLSNHILLNFDLKTGEQITEKNLFKDNYKEFLTELLINRLIEENKELSSIDDLKKTDYWVDSIRPNSNFYITDEGISYIFNPYEISPYYVGETEIFLPYARLKNILKPGNPIEYLYREK